MGAGKNVWLVNINAEHWKGWEHDRWLTAAVKPGSMFLFGTPSPAPSEVAEDTESTRRSLYLSPANKLPSRWKGMRNT